MKFEYRADVEPVTVKGSGIPFTPRTMWAVVLYTRVDEGGWQRMGETSEAYWSRRVALRIAEERLKMTTALVRSHFDSLMPGTQP